MTASMMLPRASLEGASYWTSYQGSRPRESSEAARGLVSSTRVEQSDARVRETTPSAAEAATSRSYLPVYYERRLAAHVTVRPRRGVPSLQPCVFFWSY